MVPVESPERVGLFAKKTQITPEKTNLFLMCRNGKNLNQPWPLGLVKGPEG